jgi:glycosyltransferase involved in cell wall biosynthesis
VTKAHDPDDFAQAINRIARDSKLRAEMGREARQRVIDRSWPRAFQKFWKATEL